MLIQVTFRHIIYPSTHPYYYSIFIQWFLLLVIITTRSWQYTQPRSWQVAQPVFSRLRSLFKYYKVIKNL